MGQGEVLNLLVDHPRLTTREIAELLDWSCQRVSFLLQKLIKSKDIIADKPTEEELERILVKFPRSVYCIWQLKVFEVRQ